MSDKPTQTIPLTVAFTVTPLTPGLTLCEQPTCYELSRYLITAQLNNTEFHRYQCATDHQTIWSAILDAILYPEDPAGCPKCGSDEVFHMTHVPGRWYECDECNYQFTQLGSASNTADLEQTP